MRSVPGQSAARPLRVLEGCRPPQPQVDYIDQIVGPDEPAADFRYFGGSLPDVDVDVVHVHQLEGLLGGRSAGGVERVMAAWRAARALKRSRTALVQTIAKPRGRQRGIGDVLAYRILDSVTSAFIVVDQDGKTPDARRTIRIPHAHYRERFLGYPRADQVDGRILYISRKKLGATTRAALGVFSVTERPDVTLRVAGQAGHGLEEAIARASARRPGGVSARIEPLSDAMVIEEMSAAEMVLLPSLETFREKSMLMIALSLQRPVIVPDSPTCAQLASEVGAGWVERYAGELSAVVLERAVENLRAGDRGTPPDLEGRGLSDTAAQYAAVFRAAAEQSRRSSRRLP